MKKIIEREEVLLTETKLPITCFRTEDNELGIRMGPRVIIKPLSKWFNLAEKNIELRGKIKSKTGLIPLTRVLDELGCSRPYLKKLTDEKYLKEIKLKGKIFFSSTDFQRILDGHEMS